MKKYLFILFIVSLKLLAQNEQLDNKFRLAQSFEQSGQLDKAETIYKELSQLQKWNYSYFDALNKILIAQKKYDESIKIIQEKINETPADINLYGLIGSTYFYKDSVFKAFDYWEKGISVNPNSQVTYRIITNYAIENRAYEQAIDYLKRGQAISAEPFLFSLELSNIYAVNMNFAEAVTELCKIILWKPEQLELAKSRLNSFIQRTQAAEQVIEAAKKFVDENNKPELQSFLVYVYQQTGKYNLAFSNVVELDRITNGGGTAVFIFAQDAYRGGEFKYASQAFDYIIKKHPSSPYFIPAQIGFARTLEADLDLQTLKLLNSWKPIQRPAVFNKSEYEKLIYAYDNFNKQFGNSNNAEALFRIAEIYNNRLLLFHKADSVYSIIIKSFFLSDYSIPSAISKSKILIQKNDLESAQKTINDILINPRIEPNKLAEINYLLGKIEFWKGSFSSSLNYFKEATRNLESDISNDALEYSFLINSSKKDSVNLARYAKADLLLLQNNVKDAATEFKALGDNDNLFIINQFAKINLANIFILDNNFSEAILVLESLQKGDFSSIFAEKTTFLLAQVYQFGIIDLKKAEAIYQILLEKFPNSPYFDRARDFLNGIKTKSG